MLAWKSLYHLSPTMMSGTYAAKHPALMILDNHDNHVFCCNTFVYAQRRCKKILLHVIVVNNHNHNPAKLLTGIVQNQSTKNKLAKFT